MIMSSLGKAQHNSNDNNSMKKDTRNLLVIAAAAYGLWWYKFKRAAPAEAPLTVQPNIYAANTNGGIYGPSQF